VVQCGPLMNVKFLYPAPYSPPPCPQQSSLSSILNPPALRRCPLHTTSALHPAADLWPTATLRCCHRPPSPPSADLSSRRHRLPWCSRPTTAVSDPPPASALPPVFVPRQPPPRPVPHAGAAAGPSPMHRCPLSHASTVAHSTTAICLSQLRRRSPLPATTSSEVVIFKFG
jgi:hypothetical protein